MPIRFRCAYCNQLMGIARRKAGTVVRCPKCAGEVIVPTAQEPQPANVPSRLNAMFEAADFGKEFGELAAPAPQPGINPLMPPPPYGHPPLLETEAQEPPHATVLPDPYVVDEPMSSRKLTRPGVFLTVPILIGAGSAMLLVIAVIFLLGFFLGRSMAP